ncbi:MULTISPECIES: DUF6112 family protein [unclassified Pseudofrankia]|uniref:DUF6112 family protein n=1 Tax=unclassified Pseudofrankia TaxID=2994372 RepID=UPI0008DA076E|nr:MULTISPECIES: DUF6112 family protein [unclassified Pseudofrankia]MDT3446616.1 DUF6112 family protein [Pseudofrankia sp. BMG5.37]OHV44463.1 hypothetical protein BCD48_02805 [Pseudofrankia sp. BMG5.36]
MIAEAASARAAVLLVAVQVSPDPTKAPGINALKDLVNGLAAYAAIAAVASILLGGIAWALGDRMGLDRASSVGKSGVLAGCGLAFLVGIAAVLVNFFLATGSSASAGTPQTGSTDGQRPPAVVQVVDSATVVHGEPSAYS